MPAGVGLLGPVMQGPRLKRFARGLALLPVICGLVLLFRLSIGHARDVPPLTARVNDTANMLPAEARGRLELRLAQYEQSSGHQWAVLTVDTLAGDPLEDFSIRVVESWKLGKKGSDEGLLLLVVRDDRKVRIEVGYGLEGVITDALSSRVIRETLTPAFRRGDYAGGIEQAIQRLMVAASGGLGDEPASAPASRRARGGSPLLLIFLLIFIVLPMLGPLAFMRRRRRFGVGGLGAPWGGFGGSGYRSGGFGGFGGFGGGGGGFRGGGGGFGGGGASGSW